MFCARDYKAVVAAYENAVPRTADEHYLLGFSYLMLGDLVHGYNEWFTAKQLEHDIFKGRDYRITAGSMLPTLRVGDLILSDEPFCHAADIRRGDVVVFVRGTMTYLKRVVAMPGDRLEVRDLRVLVNGVASTEGYARIDETGAGTSRADFGPLTLRPGEYFLLGDNRGHAFDSLQFGPVERRNIRGRALLIYGNEAFGTQELIVIR